MPGSEENITEALEWAGIPYDEGTVHTRYQISFTITHFEIDPLKDKGLGPYRQVHIFMFLIEHLVTIACHSPNEKICIWSTQMNCSRKDTPTDAFARQSD